MEPTAPAPPGRPKNYNWLWYFLVVFGLSAAAVTIMIWYNLSQQLTPEQLKEAKSLWKEHGPKSYEMTYKVNKTDSERPEVFHVRVRYGHVVGVTLDGNELPPRQYGYYGMPAMFEQIQRFLEMGEEPDAQRTFTRAVFAPTDGHVQWYVRRVMGSKERVEIIMDEFQPLPEKEP